MFCCRTVLDMEEGLPLCSKSEKIVKYTTETASAGHHDNNPEEVTSSKSQVSVHIVTSCGRSDAGTAAPSTATSYSSVLLIIAIHLAFFAFSFAHSLLAPTLLAIGRLQGATVVETSTLFTWRAGGSLIGCMIWGKIFDVMEPARLFVGLLVSSAVVTACIPWCYPFALLCVAFAVQGLLIYGICLGAHFIIFRLKGVRSGPYLQSIHLLYPVAGLLSPQLVSYLILRRSPQTSLDVDVRNITALMTISNSTLHAATEGGRVAHVHLITSVIFAVGILAFIPLMCVKSLKEGKVCQEAEEVSQQDQLISGKPKRCLQVLLVLQSLMSGFKEMAVNGLLYIFAVRYLTMTPGQAATLLSVRSVFYALASIIAIFASRWISPGKYLIVNHVINLSSAAVLSLALPYNHVIIWLFGSSAAFATAVYFGMHLLWARKFFPVTGVFTSVYFIGYGLGSFGSPPLVALIMRTLGDMWLWHLNLVLVVLLFILYSVMYTYANARTK